MSRVAGADESYMLAEQYFGLSAPIQYLWIYPADPGIEAVLRLRDQLGAGALNRRVHKVRIPLARHRWVRTDRTPELYIEPQPVADREVSTWAETRLRQSNLDPIIGNGWRLECAHTTSGRFVLSLLVSHMIADGQGLYNALSAAHHGTSSSALPTLDEVAGLRGLAGDLRDACSQLVETTHASRIIASTLWRQRKSKNRNSIKPAEVPSHAASERGPDTTLAIVDLDKREWNNAAEQCGGTSNSLLIAVIGGVVQRAGCTVTDDRIRICIAVNRREDGDERANASGGVWIRVPQRIDPGQDLTTIRRLSKEALIEYTTSGNKKVADNLQTIVRLLPKDLIGKMMRSVIGPDATVSNLGVAPAAATAIGEHRAESFAVRAIMQGHTPADRRRQGPSIAAWAVEYGDKMTLTVFGIHPDHFGDQAQLLDHLEDELIAWGQSPKRW